jgi:ATP-dependent DNA helicase RecQ
VFAVDNGIPRAPVLLVDDVIDSGWTMTVLAALLKQQGSGNVYPLALASSATGD